MGKIFNSSFIDKVFVAIVAVALLIPAMHINRDGKSITENRMLAVRPELITPEHKINSKFGVEYDKWFSDRFFGRDLLIKLYSSQGGSTGSLQVLVENDDWLFLRTSAALRGYANLDKFTDNELEQIKTYLVDIDDWCKKHNKKFVFFIAPDKNKIYGEHITKVIKKFPDSESRSKQLMDYLRENSNITAIYPYEELHANKHLGLLYLKNDTHWNALGAYFGYKEIMKALNISPLKYTKMKQITYPRSDLSNMAPNIPEDNSTIYSLPDIKKKYDDNCIFNSRDDTHCTNKNYMVNKSVFTFRDSFSIELGQYYANTFKSVDFRWRVDMQKDDLEYIKDNIDIVILEIVERNLSGLPFQKFPKD